MTLALPWCHLDITLAFHGVTLALPWCYPGVTLALHWHYHDVTLAFHGGTLALPWCYPGATYVPNTMSTTIRFRCMQSECYNFSSLGVFYILRHFLRNAEILYELCDRMCVSVGISFSKS